MVVKSQISSTSFTHARETVHLLFKILYIKIHMYLFVFICYISIDIFFILVIRNMKSSSNGNDVWSDSILTFPISTLDVDQVTTRMNFGIDWEAEHRRILLEGNAALERSSQSVARSQTIAVESEQIGTEVISDLGEQRERLLRAKGRLSQTDEELNKTQKILTIMRMRVLTNKIVLIFIILLEIVILGITVYLKYFHHK